MTISRIFLSISLAVSFLSPSVIAQDAPSSDYPHAPKKVRKFLESFCYDCHQGDSSEGGLDLETLSDELSKSNSHKWRRIFDRVESNEMPPEDGEEVKKSARNAFLSETGDWINEVQTEMAKSIGRVGARRLTNLQLERTLHDLLGINIPLANRMPDEPRTGGFTTIADGQSMSHFQMKQHVDIVDIALDNAFARGFSRKRSRKINLNAEKIARPTKQRRSREPELIDGHAVTWSSRMNFYGKILDSAVEEDGWYRVTVRAKGLKPPKGSDGVWCTVRSGFCSASAPLMNWIGSFEAGKKVKEVTFDAWIPQGHMLEIRPGDSTLKIANFKSGQVETGVGAKLNVSGVAIDSITIAPIEPGGDNDAIRSLLFNKEKVLYSKGSGKIKPKSPAKTLKALMYRFAKKAFRRPINKDSIEPYVAIALKEFRDSGDFVTGLRVGYRTLLCSPRFMFLYEKPGKLDDFSIASQLSYLLWNRMLDGELWILAAKGELSKPEVLKEQVERMLKDPRGKQFVVDFADQWLNMNEIDFTEPDRKRYPGFDPIVQDAMLTETHLYLQEMLDEDISVGALIDSNFTFLNSRLAKYYEIDKKISGDEMQKVSLPKSSPRGGLLTHGSVLKVTANGSNTSPVVRGVWISEKLLGQHIPPPPENVPAIEPDIRGATTIREMLLKHEEDGQCAACHRKIDPPGFAMENFDPSGRWRDTYGGNKKRKKKKAQSIDTSFRMPDGQAFGNLEQFKKLLLKDKARLATNVVEKLFTYGTGALIQYSDRDNVEQCVKAAAGKNYGFKSLLKEVVTNELFLTK